MVPRRFLVSGSSRPRTRGPVDSAGRISARPFRPGNTGSLRQALSGHSISTAYELGWSTLKNGELLRSAEEQGFDILVTTDTNLRYQQNLAARHIAVVVLSTTSWPCLRAVVDRIASAVDSASAGSYVEVFIPQVNSVKSRQKCKRHDAIGLKIVID